MLAIFVEIIATQHELPAILEHLADDLELLRKLVLPIGEGRVERGEGGSAVIHAEFGVEASIGRTRLRGQLVGQFIFDLAVDPVIVEIGRESCREIVCQYMYISLVAVSYKK